MKHLLKNQIKVFGNITRDEYNEETFSNAEYYNGRFQLKNKLLTDDKGEDVMADAVIYIDKEATELSIGTKVEVSNQAYRVIGLSEHLNDLANRQFYQVWVQRWDV